MRFSTIASLLIAVILAIGAVFAAQTWMSSERQELVASLQAQLSAQQTAAQEVEEAPNETIVVAAEAIQFGERISITTVREIEWVGEIRPEGSYEKISDLVIGDSEEEVRFSLTNMAVGEPILASKVTEPGQRAKLSTALTPGMKAVSIRVNDVLGVAGFVLPGDRVDILLTRDGFVDVLLQGVKVLAIDQIYDDRTDNPSVVRTVTFEVNTLEAQKLVLGANVGTLSLTLRNLASTDIEAIERVTVNDLNDFDVADDIVEANLQEVAEEPDPSDARLEGLEQMLRDLSQGVSEKLEGVEARLAEEPEPVIQEVIVERVIEVAPVLPVRSTIGVIRNGQRNEYKVDRTEDEEAAEDDAADTLEELEEVVAEELQTSDEG